MQDTCILEAADLLFLWDEEEAVAEAPVVVETAAEVVADSVFAVDMGTRNFGFCCVNRQTSESVMGIFDLHVYEKVELDLKETHASWLAQRLVDDLWEYLKDCTLVVFENQMRDIYKAMVSGMMCILQTRGIRSRIVRPEDVREYWDIHGKSYQERKMKSLTTGVMDDSDAKFCRTLFNKNDGKVHVDAEEAALLAMYAVHNYDQLVEPVLIQELPSKKKRRAPLVHKIIKKKTKLNVREI